MATVDEVVGSLAGQVLIYEDADRFVAFGLVGFLGEAMALVFKDNVVYWHAVLFAVLLTCFHASAWDDVLHNPYQPLRSSELERVEKSRETEAGRSPCCSPWMQLHWEVQQHLPFLHPCCHPFLHEDTAKLPWRRCFLKTFSCVCNVAREEVPSFEF